MPKPLSENERDHIKKRLLEEGKYCLERYGVRKTTVDEIVRRANIPKGTFYLFYNSKELLLFDVFLRIHDDYQEKLITELSDLKDGLTAESMTEILFQMYKAAEESSLLGLTTSGELELLFRKLPPETAAIHAQKDNFQLEALAPMIPNLKAGSAEVYSAALRAVFLAMLHRQDIGETVFDAALKLMLRGIAIQMFEGEKND